MKHALWLTVIMVTLLMGCSGSAPPETVRYLLRAPQPATERAALEAPNIGIGRVTIAPYLNQLGIVVETGPGQIRSARYNLWAEPFDQGVRHYLRQSLSGATGSDVGIDPALSDAWAYRLDVRFDEFHGTGSGEVRMAGEYTWTDVSSGTAARRQVFADVQRLSDDGYGAMVAAHEALLDRLVRSMAETLPSAIARAAD